MFAPIAIFGSYHILVAGPGGVVNGRSRSRLGCRKECTCHFWRQRVVICPALSRAALHQREHLTAHVHVIPGERDLALHEHGQVWRIELKLMQWTIAAVGCKESEVVTRHTSVRKLRQNATAGLGQRHIHRVTPLG